MWSEVAFETESITDEGEALRVLMSYWALSAGESVKQPNAESLVLVRIK
jgi:hypothetical protein